MSTGLIALLDDVAKIAKVAAASLDDVAGQAAKAGSKAAGIVIDDAAVTPRYVVGFAADRELPIIGKIALGSLKNKVLFLLPAALILSLVAPWVINPLLMLGGAYLCYEGAEKIVESIWPHHAHGPSVTAAVLDARSLEDQKVASAIKTDFILSAEIMAITLSTVVTASIWLQGSILAVVGIGITLVVYGAVALIVKADDAGMALAQNERPASTLLGMRGSPAGATPSGADRALRPLTMGLGRGLVYGMPIFLKVLSLVGTAAMLWVGGGIIIHGLEEYGITGPGHAIHDVAAAVGHAVAPIAGFLEWLVTAAISGVAGLVLGVLLIPLVHRVLVPAIKAVRGTKTAQPRAH